MLSEWGKATWMRHGLNRFESIFPGQINFKSLLANLCAAAGADVYFQFSSAAMQTSKSQNFQKLKTTANNRWYCKTNVCQ